MTKLNHIIVDREQLIGILTENAAQYPEDKVYMRKVKNLMVLGFINKYGSMYREVIVSVETD